MSECLGSPCDLGPSLTFTVPEFPLVKLGIVIKPENSRKTSASLTTPKPLTVWIPTNRKILKEMGNTRLPASWEICVQVKKQQLELDMEQQTDSKLRKEYIKAVYCHPTYLTYTHSISGECRAGWSPSWNQDCHKKYQQPQICRWYHPNGRK